MGILRLSFFIFLFFLSSCKFQNNLLGDEANIDANHAPPLTGTVELGISTVADQVLDEDSTSGPILFTITGSGLDCDANVSANSDDTSIIDSSGIVIASSGEDCTITLSPIADANGGPVLITLTVSISGVSEETSFNLTVNEVSDPFTIMGTVADGELLEVDNYGPDFDASSSHQWFSDGVAISGATGATYTTTAADEGTTMTLELDGVQVSQNSLVTQYYGLYASEFRFLRISNSNINGTDVVYDNLVNSIDEGNGRLAMQSGANSSWTKRATTTSTFQEVGDVLEVVGPTPAQYSSYAIGWGPLTSINAVSSANRIQVGRGGGATNYSVRIDGVVVHSAGGGAATFQVERTADGFEVRRNGVVLYAD